MESRVNPLTMSGGTCYQVPFTCTPSLVCVSLLKGIKHLLPSSYPRINSGGSEQPTRTSRRFTGREQLTRMLHSLLAVCVLFAIQ